MHPLRLTIRSSERTPERLLDYAKEVLRESCDLTVEVVSDGVSLKAADEQRMHPVANELRKRLGASVEIGGLSIEYRETVTRSAEVEGKWIKQYGGRGQYGHVWIRMERAEEGKGVTFSNRIVQEVVPKVFILAVEEGVREALRTGPIAGYPVTDIEVSLFDGSYHDIDSTEDAFKQAAIIACKTALAKCAPVLLEPIMFVEVTTPEEVVGNVVADLSGRRGMITGMEDVASGVRIRGSAPLAEMLGYASELAKLTAGKGTSSFKFSNYAKAPSPRDPDGDEPASMALRVA
jgi:elongation factor G